MVAQTQENSATDRAGDARTRRSRQRRGGLRRLLASSLRLADLQYRLWLTQAKLTLTRMAIYAALFSGAIAFAILGLIFLCIGVFRVLTDVAQLPVWAAFLIFGGALALVAILLILIATRMLSSRHLPAALPASEDSTDVPAHGGDQ